MSANPQQIVNQVVNTFMRRVVAVLGPDAAAKLKQSASKQAQPAADGAAPSPGGRVPAELVVAMFEAAADGDWKSVDGLSELGADGEALEELLADREAGTHGMMSARAFAAMTRNFSAQTRTFSWFHDPTPRSKSRITNSESGAHAYGDQARRIMEAQGREERGEPHPETPKAALQRMKAEREPRRQQAREAYQKALKDPDSLRAADLELLAEHLHTLSRDEIRSNLRSLMYSTGGKVKAQLVDDLLAHVRGLAGIRDTKQPVEPVSDSDLSGLLDFGIPDEVKGLPPVRSRDPAEEEAWKKAHSHGTRMMERHRIGRAMGRPGQNVDTGSILSIPASERGLDIRELAPENRAGVVATPIAEIKAQRAAREAEENKPPPEPAASDTAAADKAPEVMPAAAKVTEEPDGWSVPSGSKYADVPSAGDNTSVFDTDHARGLVDRLNKYERTWIECEHANPNATEAELHRAGMAASGLTGDGLATARGYAGKKVTSSPGVLYPSQSTPDAVAAGADIEQKSPDVTPQQTESRKWTKNADGTYTSPNGTVWRKAKAGGEVSPVTGETFKGGTLMPIHGKSAQQPDSEGVGGGGTDKVGRGGEVERLKKPDGPAKPRRPLMTRSKDGQLVEVPEGHVPLESVVGGSPSKSDTLNDNALAYLGLTRNQANDIKQLYDAGVTSIPREALPPSWGSKGHVPSDEWNIAAKVTPPEETPAPEPTETAFEATPPPPPTPDIEGPLGLGQSRIDTNVRDKILHQRLVNKVHSGQKLTASEADDYLQKDFGSLTPNQVKMRLAGRFGMSEAEINELLKKVKPHGTKKLPTGKTVPVYRGSALMRAMGLVKDDEPATFKAMPDEWDELKEELAVEPAMFKADAQGHEHAPAGSSKGGQFVSKGKGGGGGASKDKTGDKDKGKGETSGDSKPAPKANAADAKAAEERKKMSAQAKEIVKRIRPVKTRATSSPQTTKLDSRLAGAIGEEVIIQYLKSLGFKDAGQTSEFLESNRNNLAFDLIHDHRLTEAKAGQCDNPDGVWALKYDGRYTKEQEASFAKMSPEEVKAAKKEINRQKVAAIHERKKAFIKEMNKRLGYKVKAGMMTCLINPDTKTVDLFRFDDIYDRIPFKSQMAQAAYIGSFRYG